MAPSLEIRKIEPSLEGFGAVVDFLAPRQPFTGFQFGPFCRALRVQVIKGENVCAFSGASLVGYCGWLPTRQPIAEAWLQGKGRLTRPPKAQPADAVALTVVAANDSAAVLPMIRAARNLNPNLRVFFKRSYPEKPGAERKSSVRNQVAEQEGSDDLNLRLPDIGRLSRP